MRVGIDFDNTIVSYDTLFHKVGVESGLVPKDTPVSKLAVRDHLRAIGREEVWTEMQGLVYGARLLEAEPFPGLVEFFRWARHVGIEVCIVSHKTKHPFIGPKYDMHAIAREWVHVMLREDGDLLVPEADTFFELTKEEKVQRIGACRCDYFIDDLPEILRAPGFPASTIPVLFAPGGGAQADIDLTMTNWDAVRARLDARR